MSAVGLKAAPDFTIEQNWDAYTQEEHAVWRLLFERQQKLLKHRACREYLDGLAGLGVAAAGIPDFRRLSEILDRSYRLAHCRGAGAGPGRGIFRSSGAPTVSVDLLYPRPRSARLFARARYFSRYLRSRAVADEPDLCRLHAGLREGWDSRRKASATYSVWRGFTGTRSSSG